jgi:type II secretory ATPase GspE/PulE/Tfp pilus assembly ATPase PilB-like protein/ActR/RegA family two-component response regulator
VREACEITDEELLEHAAAYFQLDLADLGRHETKALNLVTEPVARRYSVFPLRETDRLLYVATADPRDLSAEQALAFASGRTPRFELASPQSIVEAIEAHYSPDRSVASLLTTLQPQDYISQLESLGSEDEVRVVEEAGPEDVGEREADAAPVVALSNLILRDAAVDGASDIHIEPGRTGGVVRFRVDGVLRRYTQMPMPALNRVVSRIKVLADLDISDRLRPQDGRVRIGIENRNYDLRVSTVPTRDAEKVVIRILDPESSISLDQLGLTEREAKRVQRLLKNREGIVVVTGPTGSGKTTTLYSALRTVATGEVNVMTVEDPVEYELQGVTQMQVEVKRDFTFATALRAILRQDPDVIFVGEIRDLETAEIAVQASLTGHLVLATLHTNDALGVVTRLVDLGLDCTAIAESLRGSIAQRLVRHLCAECAQEVDGDFTDDEGRLTEKYGVEPKRRAMGCNACGNTGYRGRFPLFEIALVGAKLRERIGKGASGAELLRVAKDAGMKPLREMGVERVRSGDTTLEELERVLGEPVDDEEPVVEAPHVLVVDDDEVDRLLAREVLGTNGMDVTEARNGKAALKLIEGGEEFSLIVLDLRMPKLKGDRVLEILRGSVATVGLPVIMMTGAQDVETETRLLEQGADDYIRKPLDPAQFLARVRAVLRRASGSS